MLSEVIWVSGATVEFLRANPRQAPTEAIDGLIELIRLFPEIGKQVKGSPRLRRVMVGRHRIFGLFYTVAGKRLIIVALIDLRMDPVQIRAILESRTMEN